MFLNLWETIKNFFMETFSKIPWSNIILLLTGVVIGFAICGIMYLIILLNSIQKADKTNKKDYHVNDIVKTEDINKLINGAKDQYKEESKEYVIAQKMDLVKEVAWTLINDIASIYYPDSKYPIYELTVDELIKLCFYITNRVDNVFDGRIIKYARKFKISQIMAIIDAKKKIDDNKIIKASKKMKLGGIYKVASTAINFINPAFWVKKFMLSSTVNIGSHKIANIIIDIVGQETAKIYSKHLFEENVDIFEAIEDLEKELIEE